MNALILQLIAVIAPIVRQVIDDYRKSHNGEMPTDEQVLAELNTNLDRILAEGTDWQANHPRT